GDGSRLPRQRTPGGTARRARHARRVPRGASVSDHRRNANPGQSRGRASRRLRDPAADGRAGDRSRRALTPMEITRRVVADRLDLTITGRLDSYWADPLDSGLTETVREGHHDLRLDLSDVIFLSSAGIAVLVKFHKRLTAIKGRLVIGSASPAVRTV